MACEPALRTNAHLFQRLLSIVPKPLRHDVRRRVQLVLHLLHVLSLLELGHDDAKDDVIVRGEMKKRLEGARLHRIVHLVVGLDAEVTEELDGYAVAAAFEEILGANEVTCVKVLYQ